MQQSQRDQWTRPILLSLFCFLGAAVALAQDSTKRMQRLESQLIDTINLERRRSGVAVLQMEPTLSQAAREHSVDMAQRAMVTHDSPLPDHKTPEDRFQWVFGKSADKLTENVAVLKAGLAENAVTAGAHAALNGTPEARRNSIDREVSVIGLGCAEGPDGRIWITAMFARLAGQGATPRPPTVAATPKPPDEAGPPTAARLEELLVRAINEESGSLMLMAVSAQKLEPLMCQAAREHSIEMMKRNLLTHDSEIPGHSTVMDRYEWVLGTVPEPPSGGGAAVALYECLAAVPKGPERSVVSSIMTMVRGGTAESIRSKPESEWPEAYRRMRDVTLKTLGVGCAVGSDGGYWVTVLYAAPPLDNMVYEGILDPGFTRLVDDMLALEARTRAGAAARVGLPVTKTAATWGGKALRQGEPLPIEMNVFRARRMSPNGWGGWMTLDVEFGNQRSAQGRWLRVQYEFKTTDGKLETDGRLSGPYCGTGSISGTEDRADTLQAPGFGRGGVEIKGNWEAIPTDPRRRLYQLFVTGASGRVPAGTLWRKGTPQSEIAALRPPPAVEPTPVPVAVAEPESPALSDAEARAEDIRWLKSIDDALATAERKFLEARFKLVALKEIIGQREQRIAYLEGLLAKPRTPESDGVIESIIRMGIDVWDEATMGPSPPLGARPREVIQGQIDQLKQQVSDARKEQNELIQQTIETYYDPIAEELEARGPESKWDEIRKSAKEAIPEVKSLKGLAEAGLYLAAGQDEKFQAAVQASITDGRHAADARYLQAMYFLDKKDLRLALEGFRLVMDLTKRPDGAEAPVTSRAQAEAVAGKGDSLWQQARSMAWMLEDRYFNAVDAKASAEAHQVQFDVAERMKKGGDEGWLGGVLGYLQMGVVTATSAIVHQEDALVNLAAKYEKEVAAQHCGLLLLQSLHERGFPLDSLDALTNEQFLGVMRDYYGDAGAKLRPENGVQLRASIKAALRNPDVSRLLSGSKQMLRVDTGRDYFGHEALAPTSLDSWSNAALMATDLVSVANVAMMVMPMSTYRISGKVAGVRYTGVLGEAEAGATVQTAREGFQAATRLNQLPALLEETRAGQVMVGQARQFLATSGWTKNRALEMATFLAAGTTGEAVGGTIGVLRGTDGKTEAEAGKMIAEMLTMWTVGDADALQEAAKAHGISAEQLAAVAKKAAVETKAAAELTTVSERDLTEIRAALPSEPGAGISAEGRQAGAKMKQAVNDELLSIRRAVAEGQADANTFRRFTELGVRFRTAVALETGAEPEVRAWLAHVEKLAKEGGERTVQTGSVAKTADDARVQLAAPNAGPAPPPEAPAVDLLREGMPTLRSGNPLTKDLDELWIAKRHAEALAGYQERYAILHHLQLTEAPAVKAAELPKKIGALRTVVAKGGEITQMAKPDWVPNHLAPVTREEVERLAANPDVVLVPIEPDPLKASYSDPFWVCLKKDGQLVKIGVFKRSGEYFQKGLDRGVDLEAEEIYANLAQEFREQLGVEVPACTRAKMTVETRNVQVDVATGAKTVEVKAPSLQEGVFVRWAPGMDLEKLGPVAPALYKEQIALDKALATLFFDHDRKAGNFLVMDLEKLLSLDHSMAKFRGVKGEALASSQEVAESMEQAVMSWRNRTDVYRLLDEQITVEDMEGSIKFLETLFDNEAGRERVRKVLLKSLASDEADEVLRILTARSKVLRGVLEKCFGTVKDLKPIPVRRLPTTTWIKPGRPNHPGGPEWRRTDTLALAA